MLRLALVLPWLLLAACASAAAAEDTPAPPEPARLAADWWNYFASEPPLEAEELGKRVATSKATLKTALKGLESGRRRELQPRAAQIAEWLDHYRERRDEEPPAAPAPAPAAESYTLDKALERYREWRGLRLEIASLREETNWQQELIKAERRQHSRRKVSYLELGAAAPQRLEAGLELMATRLQLELRVLDLRRRQQRLEQLERNLATLDRELSEIAPRLSAEAAEAEPWLKQRLVAQHKAHELREELETPQAPANGDAQTPGEAAGARLSALESVELNIEAVEQDLLAHKAHVSQQLVQIVVGEDAAVDQAREALRETGLTIERLEPQKNYWKRTAERIRASVVSQDAGAASASDRAALKLSEKITQTLLRLDQTQDELRFLMRLLDERVRLHEGTLTRWLAEAGQTVSLIWQKTRELAVASLFEVNETPVTLFGLLRVAIIITVAFILSKALRRTLERLAARRTGVGQSSFYTLGRVVHYFVLGIGIIIGLSSIGIDFTKFALLASALGIGIGFGMQALVSNFVAGLIILFEKSLKVGDFVELESGVTGEVREVNMRSTLVTTNDNVDILVPNSEFINKAVTNWTLREAYRRIHVPFGVAYGSDKDLVRKAVLEAAELVPWTLRSQKQREPQVWFVGFGDSSLDFELVVWLSPDAVKRPGSVQAHYLWEIETKFKEYGIEIPFPQRDLHLRSGFESLRT